MKLISRQNNTFTLEEKGKIQKGSFYQTKNFVDIHYQGKHFRIDLKNKARSSTHEVKGSLEAPMPGKILKILVEIGQKVENGQTLILLEAMKMEHKVNSPQAGQVKNLFFKEGDRVSQGDLLIEVS